MEIRMLKEQEISPALCLIKDVFQQDIAPVYSESGVNEFHNSIDEEIILQQVRQKKLYFWGAGDQGELVGVIAMSALGHITYLFVVKSYQSRKLGSTLLKIAKEYATKNLGLKTIDVNATPNAVEFYMNHGFTAKSTQQNVNGLLFVPMKYVNSNKDVPTKQNGSHNAKRFGILVVVIIVCVVLANFAFQAIKLIGQFKDSYSSFGNIQELPFGNGNEEEPTTPFGNNGETDSDAEKTGIQAIEEYISPNLSYEIEDAKYQVDSDQTSNMTTYFSVSYPKVSGLDTDSEQKINTLLETTALETTEKIYLNPSDSIKEKLKNTDHPYLESQVTYKVTYATEDLLCVAFQDYSVAGSETDTFQQLRTVTVNIKTGEEYKLSDIVKINDDFIETWLKVMRNEASNDHLLSELDHEQLISVLKGNPIQDNYYEAYFLKKGGIEIGCSFNYPANDVHNLGFGWVTAPFSFGEIKTFQTNDKFWNYFSEDI